MEFKKPLGRLGSQDEKPSNQNSSIKKIFNSIEEFEKGEISFISNKQSMDENRFGDLAFDHNESIDMKSIKEEKEMKIYENRSVQYSEMEEGKDYMNRSIQYEEDEGYHCDFAIQIDDGSLPREINLQFVQTEPVNFAQEAP